MDIADIFPPKGQAQRLYCDKCSGYLDLTYTDFQESLSGVDVAINGLPTLRCDSCELTFLPDNSRFAIIEIHKQAVERKSPHVIVNRRKPNTTYDFTEVPFIYDSDDHRYIPGLYRPLDVGFLTPVFFNRGVLLKYDASPDYRVQFASTTYGNIRRDDDFMMPFGFNKNGRIIMWLGDIAKLPVEEQYYLRSENIPSDHSIGSEFYDAQIECKFTERTRIDHLFRCRSDFIEGVYVKTGIKIAHLDDEVISLALSFNGPVVDSEKERRHVADTLNKIYVESLNGRAIGEALVKLGVAYDEKTGGLKRLQSLVGAIAPGLDPAKMLSPFFTLYDFRVAHSHLTSEARQKEILDTVLARLTLSGPQTLFSIYDALIEGLIHSYEEIGKFLPIRPAE